MLDAPVAASAPVERPVAQRRRPALLVLGAVVGLATALIAAVQTVATVSGGTQSVLVGPLGSGGLIGLATVAALCALAVGLCLIPVPRLGLVLLVPARLGAFASLAIAGFVWMLLTPGPTIVPLVSGGCDSGYVVAENSFLSTSGTVYRQDGLLVTPVAHTSGNHAYRPFASGAYTVDGRGSELDVWYDFSDQSDDLSTAKVGPPAFVVPKLTDRTHTCGVQVARPARYAPSPAPTTRPLETTASDMRTMIARSLAAAVGPVRDASGAVIDATEQTPRLAMCEATSDSGRFSDATLDLAFRTDDNAASARKILAVWDAAGYLSDRAMHEDIRYSTTLPVAKMSLRDTTTIDGLIHMQVTSRCASRD